MDIAKKVLEALESGREKISRPESWAKGTYELRLEDGTVCYCSVGAVRDVRFDSETYWATRDMLDGAVPADFELLTLSSNTIEYNDHEDTTHDDVLALFDRAIEAAREAVAA